MKTHYNYIINQLKNKLNIQNIYEEKLTLLNRGRFANADVYRYCDGDGHDYTIKDFAKCNVLIRTTFGKLMASIEYNRIQKLKHISGIAAESFMLSPYTVGFTYINGVPLKKYNKNKHSIPTHFFEELEEVITKMHEVGYVHLDLRNLGNIIIGKSDIAAKDSAKFNGDHVGDYTDDYASDLANIKPYIIDFQSSIPTNGFFMSTVLKPLKIALEKSDISGVYKAWRRLAIDEIPADKEKYYQDFKKIRKLWIFRGYPLSRAIKKFKKSRNKK